jgi:hypothetical protein
MTVQDPDGTYRPLDGRTMDELAAADTWRHGMRRIREIEAANQKREESIDQDFTNHIADVAREHRKQILKEIDQHIGAINVPMEDLMAPEEAPGRRGSWMGSQGRHPRSGRRLSKYSQVIEV